MIQIINSLMHLPNGISGRLSFGERGLARTAAIWWLPQQGRVTTVRMGRLSSAYFRSASRRSPFQRSANATSLMTRGGFAPREPVDVLIRCFEFATSTSGDRVSWSCGRLSSAHLNAVQFIQPIGALEKSQARIRLGLIFMNTRPMLSFTIWLSRASVDEIISRKFSPVVPTAPSRACKR